MSRPIWLVTWNLQGAEGVDVPEVVERITSMAAGAPDVVVLQEVHRDQARALAAELGMDRTWAFKHWPVVRGMEGMAVLTRGRVTRSRPVIVHPAPAWSWRRRISLLAEVELDDQIVHLVDVHLSPHDLGAARLKEVSITLGAARALGWADDLIVVGDCNDLPGSTGPAGFVAAGFTDAWSATQLSPSADDGPTNWTVGDRSGRPPTQRLDYVFLPATWTCLELHTAQAGPSGWEEWAALSDHLPVAARLQRGDQPA